jgi:hypothetical protein
MQTQPDTVEMESRPQLRLIELAGDKARSERVACGGWCEGCPICEEELFSAPAL